MEATEVVARRALLCSLPTEVKQTILCHLPDLHALKAAILSHSSLYSAFVDRKESIAFQDYRISFPMSYSLTQCLPLTPRSSRAGHGLIEP